MYFREREDGDAYALEVVTLDNETPDEDAVARAIAASVPAGIVVAYRSVLGWDYQAMTTEGGTYTALKTRFDDYQKNSENDRS